MGFLLFFILADVLLVPYLRLFVGGAPIYIRMVLIPMMVVLALRHSPAAWRSSPLRLWFWLFLGAMCFSSAVQVVLLGSLKFSSYTLITHLLPLLLLPALIIWMGYRPRLFMKLRWWWAIFATIAAIWCIAQVVDHELGINVIKRFDNWYYFTVCKITAEEWLVGRMETEVARGVAGAWNPNAVGPILVISLPIALSLPQRRHRVLIYAMSIIMLFGIVGTGSRQSMLGILVVLAVLLLPGLSRRHPVVRTEARRPALALLAILVLGALGYVGTGFGRAQFGRLAEGAFQGMYTRAGGYARFASYMTTGGIQTVVGQGPDARRVGGRTGNFKVAAAIGFVSNSWLLPLVEFGVAGFVAQIGMFAVAWKMAREHWARACLAALAWVMICDNAIHAVHFGPVLMTLGLATAALTATQADYLAEQQAAEEYFLESEQMEPAWSSGGIG